MSGLFVKLPLTEIVDLASDEGFDFLIIDLEHSQLSEGQARTLVRHAEVVGIPALVRVTDVDRGQINRLLEAGAAGVQLSTVTSVAQVHGLRDALHYAPAGKRSVALSHRRAGYGSARLNDHIAASAAAAPLMVIQLETPETDDPLDVILSAGPDVAFG